MPAGALTPKVTRASAGMVLAVQRRQAMLQLHMSDQQLYSL